MHVQCSSPKVVIHPHPRSGALVMKPATPARNGACSVRRGALAIDTPARCSLQLSFASPTARADDRWVHHCARLRDRGMDYPRTGFAERVSGRAGEMGGEIVSGRRMSGRRSGRSASWAMFGAREGGSWESSILVSALERGARLVSLGQWGLNLWLLEGDDSASSLLSVSCCSIKLRRL